MACKFILNKTQEESKLYLRLLDEMNQLNAVGWVNTNRRYFPIYQKIKNSLSTENLQIIVKAENKGLGSNAIHFIDLFQWFIENSKIQLNGDFLDDKIFPNKRGKDLVEFAGKISGKIGNST